MSKQFNNSGFLHDYLLDGSGRGHAVDTSDHSAGSKPGQTRWVHLDVADEQGRRWLIEKSGVTENVADALLAGETRPRSFVTDKGLLVVLRGVNMNPGDDPEDMVSVRIWIEKDRVISSRRREILSVQDVRATLEAGTGPKTSGEFLAIIVEKLADRIGAFVDNIEDRLEENEDQLQSLGAAVIRKRLAMLRRQMAGVRRFLAPQRDALDRLYRQPGDLLSSVETSFLREESDRITRYLEDIDLARERAVVLQEEILSQMAQEQNTRMYVLSVVAAIFLPLTFVTGLLGMNVGGLPGLEDPRGFWTAVGIMAISSAAMIMFFRWKKWI